MMRSREVLLVAALCGGVGCAVSPPPGMGGTGGAGGASMPVPGTVTISGATPTPVTTTVGVNYWLWPATWGNIVKGTDADIALLAPRFLRIGGHNNDNNMPDHLDGTALADAVAYARAVGAQPLLQVPLLADASGVRPTADDAAALVTLANVTGGHGIKYFSIGNEPDLYPEQEASLKTYTPADYCAQVTSFVAAMKAADPTIMIVGPDLSWKYQAGNDWLTPILTTCGAAFDIIAVHRYPFAPEASTAARAEGDAAQFSATITRLRALMNAAGMGTKPLAITETNITYDGAPEKSIQDASPGTLPAGLWTADLVGTARAGGLWTMLYWSASESWTLGLIAPAPRQRRPAYHALRLWAEHAGPTALAVTGVPTGVHAYASRNAAGTATVLMVVNWSRLPQALVVMQTNIGGASPAPVTVTVPPTSRTAIEIADSPPADDPPGAAWTYGPEQKAAGGAAAPLAVTAETR
jgi:Glycosyl hydrolase catalytic core